MALHGLSSITVGVPDPVGTGAFYEDFGLTALGNGHFATKNGGDQFRLTSAPYRRIEEIAVRASDADDLARISHNLRNAGHEFQTHTDGSITASELHANVRVVIRIEDRLVHSPIDGIPVNSPAKIERTNRPADVITRSHAVQPSQLSHLVIGSPNYDATLSFFVDVLGFQISDQLSGIIAFTRCSESHHNVAVQSMPGAFLHHVAFEVDSVDEVLRGGSNMIEAAAERHMWGLGRHAIGSNWFWYLRDPAGNFVEYTADVDAITSQDLYVPKAWAGKEYLYAYGPAVPEEFLAPKDAADVFAAQAAS